MGATSGVTPEQLFNLQSCWFGYKQSTRPFDDISLCAGQHGSREGTAPTWPGHGQDQHAAALVQIDRQPQNVLSTGKRVGPTSAASCW